MKARDYLVGLGLAKPGRGKFSKAGHKALQDALANGKKFTDYPKTDNPTKKTATKKTTDNSEPVVSAANSSYYFPSDYRYPETDFKVKAKVGGKSYSLRECCNTCRVSLVNHACDNPTIHGSIAVEIVRR